MRAALREADKAFDEGEVPVGQVVDQVPPPGTTIQPGDLVTLIVSR